MSKQDRQGVRTPADVERKYNLGQIAVSQGTTAKQEIRLSQLTQAFEQFMAATNSKIEELKNIESTQNWFYSGIPTLENLPAAEWDTDEIKKQHIGDIYVDTDTGNMYFFRDGANGYEWFAVAVSETDEASYADILKFLFVNEGGTSLGIGDIPLLANFLEIFLDVMLRGSLYLPTNQNIYGIDSDGNYVMAFQPQNSNGNTVIGYGNWERKKGYTNLYGNDLTIYSAAAGDSVRPYYRKGDSVTVTFSGAGFVTTGGKDVCFSVPLDRPILGSPTVSVASVGGLILRQSNKYTHGSASGAGVSPAKYTATLERGNVRIVANMSDTTNVLNNDSIGIYWNGTISFS